MLLSRKQGQRIAGFYLTSAGFPPFPAATICRSSMCVRGALARFPESIVDQNQAPGVGASPFLPETFRNAQRTLEPAGHQCTPTGRHERNTTRGRRRPRERRERAGWVAREYGLRKRGGHENNIKLTYLLFHPTAPELLPFSASHLSIGEAYGEA